MRIPTQTTDTVVATPSSTPLRVMQANLLPPGPGGIERLLPSFHERLDSERFDIEMCILDAINNPSAELVGDECQLFSLDRRTDRFDWGLYRRLYELFKVRKPDIVHLHGTAPILFVIPAARAAGIRNLLYTCHFTQPNPSRRKRWVMRRLLRLVPRKIAVSRAARDVLVRTYRVAPEEITIIPNGVDLESFSPHATELSTNTVTIGFCGVFRPEKRIPLLLRAFDRVRRRVPTVRLLLVGDGPEMPACQELTDQLGIRELVTFAGQQSDVRPFLRQMDIAALPSSEEAMPVALLEAMATGLPVVASAVGGVLDIVAEEEQGTLVPPDDLVPLSAALIRLAGDADLRRRNGEAARGRVEEMFSIESMMDAYATAYTDLVH